jgi:hypothetical protein
MAISVPMVCRHPGDLALKNFIFLSPAPGDFPHIALSDCANLATRVPPKCIYFRQDGVEFIFSSPIWRYIATISSTDGDRA